MKIIAVPRIFAEKNKGRLLSMTDTLVVSIIDSGVNPVFHKDAGNVLTVVFDDVHPTTVGTIKLCEGCVHMTPKQANEIIDFIMDNIKGKKRIIVHCTAGICRSGAVVDFLSRILPIDMEWFKTHNTHIIPNEWVRDLLWCQWMTKVENV